MWEYWESLSLSSGWKSSFEAALGTGQHIPVHSMGVTHFQPSALLHMPLSGNHHHGGMIPLRVSKRGRNGMEMLCHLPLCSVRIFWGVSRLFIAVNSPLCIDIKENQTWEIFMSRASVAFLPCLPSQLDCWRPDGNGRYSAVNHEPFTSPTVQSEQNQAFPPKTQYCWRCNQGLPFVCN